MNILLIGYGKMGRQIEEIAAERGHCISGTVDINNNLNDIITDLNTANSKNIDVAIEFTSPSAVMDNINTCFNKKIPLVVGTTGWYDNIDAVKQRVKQENLSFLYSSNFAIGVYLFRQLNIYLAKIMNNHKDYTPSITEIHHIHKKDAPSGTAITLANELLGDYKNITQWQRDIAGDSNIMPVNSVRKGEEFGTHIVSYDSMYDSIEIKHTAKSRRSLALGAVLGAEFLLNRQGFFTMEDLMNSLLKN